jgi:hypothetical protein
MHKLRKDVKGKINEAKRVASSSMSVQMSIQTAPLRCTFKLTSVFLYKSSMFSIAVRKLTKGRAIAQAVSRWLPTAAARVRARVWSSGIYGGQSGAGADFL